MKNRLSFAILLFTGILLIFFACFFYAEFKPMPNTNSSRVADLNWLYYNLGKTPSALLFASIGIFICILAAKKIKKK